MNTVVSKLLPTLLVLVGVLALKAAPRDDAPLRAGFGETDITPPVGGKPVYLAGFGHDRKATGVHDKLHCRAVVLEQGKTKIAMASIDLVGVFLPHVERVRKKLPEFSYVLVTSTHNHEGPDTLGIWGPTFFKSGVDPDYMEFVESQIVKAVRAADAGLRAVSVRVGKANAPELLHDSRLPLVKHDELVALAFDDVKEKKPCGVVVQWNCHPETLGSDNKLVSADYVGYTVDLLKEKYHCPVVYFTGTVGGLMTSLHVPIKDDQGRPLNDGTYEKTAKYGQSLGQVAIKALAASQPIQLTPLSARSKSVYLPLDNAGFQIARRAGVLNREGFLWQDDPYRAGPLPKPEGASRLATKSEVGWLKLGELEVALIPGEIYPELVLDKVQDPVEPGADFPDAPIEPAIYKQMKAPHKMMIGLANDEIGYIIPKRQWDDKPPFCYGRKSKQYGEVNSMGPETAPILCRAFKELTEGK